MKSIDMTYIGVNLFLLSQKFQCFYLLQEQGCHSDGVCKLAHSLVEDFCLLYPNVSEAFISLPKVSPLFTCNFISAAVTIFYFNGEYMLYGKNYWFKCIEITKNFHVCMGMLNFTIWEVRKCICVLSYMYMYLYKVISHVIVYNSNKLSGPLSEKIGLGK